jgi:hypothetical protein
LLRYSNGTTTGFSIAVFQASFVLAPKQTFVICHSSIVSPGACDALTSSINHNGNDAYELVCGGVTMDVFGQIGVDPLTAWTGGGLSTQDQTLRRKCSVTSGDPVGSDAFDPSIEWTGEAADTLSGLGTHCP